MPIDNLLNESFNINQEKLKKMDSVYIIGHNNLDADSYFSSYILSKILK